MKKLFLALMLALCAVFALAGLAACDLPSGTGGTQQGDNTGDQTGGDTGGNTDSTGDNTEDNTGGEEQIKSYNVTVTCGEGGSYTLSHENPIQVNTSVTLTVTENVGYEVSRVTVGGRRVDLADLSYTFEVRRNTAIEITFKSVPIVYRSVKVNCDEGGTYEISHSGNDVAERTVVTLTVTPDADHEFDVVYINGAVAVFEEGVCTFTVRGNTTVVVHFKQHVHAYPDWTIQNPTDSATGIATRTCPNCTEEATGHTVTHTLPELGDSAYNVRCDRKENCEFEGLYTYTITLEGDEIVFVHTVGLLPHTYEYSVHDIPLTFREGSAIGVCSVCSEKARGHVRAITLPAVDEETYTITDRTEPTCTTGSTAKCSITIQGHPLTFVMENADETGHTFVNKESDGKTYQECSVCGENNKTSSDTVTGMVGTWRNQEQTVKVVKYADGKVSVNGSEPVLGEAKKDMTGYFYTYGSEDDEKTYNIEQKEINVTQIDGSKSTVYYTVFSEIATGTNVRITQHLFRNDYPFSFPEEICGGMWSATVMGENASVRFDGCLLYVKAYLVTITSYNYTETGFKVNCSYGAKEAGIDSGKTGSYSVEYDKTTGKITLTDRSVKDEDGESSGLKKTAECTRSENSGSTEHKGVFPDYPGLYVAVTGDVFTIDERGVLYFNNQYVAVDFVEENKKTHDLVYKFLARSCAWTVVVNEDYITAVCPALGIEELIFYLQVD